MRRTLTVALLVGLGSFAGLLACSSGGGSGSFAGGDGGANGEGGTNKGTSGGPGGEGGPGTGGTGPLPLTTFLYVAAPDGKHDRLMAYDRTTGQSRLVTDLRDGSVEGWTIEGYAISPDRTRIAFASNYGATKEDNDTNLATRRIWSIATDGSDLRRLTPVFPNLGGGKTLFNIDVRNPTWDADGSRVFFQYGEFWYEGTNLQGGSEIRYAAADGSLAAATFRESSPCSNTCPSPNPKTGEVAVVHSVCIPGSGQENGVYLHAADGTGAPQFLVGRPNIDIQLETPRWIASGEGFSFIGSVKTNASGQETVLQGLFAYDATTGEVTPLVVPEQQNTRVVGAAPAPDLNAIAYCLREGDSDNFRENLHLIDLTATPPTDTPLTTDGTSCYPVW